MVARYAGGSAERERISAAMSRPSVFDSFVRYLADQGYDVPRPRSGTATSASHWMHLARCSRC